MGKTKKYDVVNRSQTSAMLMSLDLRGLDQNETRKSTQTMLSSGSVFSELDEWIYLVVDKVSHVLAPALAAIGLKIPIISKCTSGTRSKLEIIPGFKVCSTEKEIYETVNSSGCCIVGQKEDFDLTDNIFSQCREITAGIKYPPFIVASVFSKECIEQITALVYDVKYGKGSIFRTKEEAEENAKNLVQSSKSEKTSALLTSMENPLGRSIGNSVEIVEAIGCLKGKGPSDIVQLACALGSELLQLIRGTTKEEGTNMILNVLKNEKALQKFESMIIHQGVIPEIAFELCYSNASFFLPKTWYRTDIIHDGEHGYVQELNPLVLVNVYEEVLMQGKKHPGVGLTFIKTVEDKIKKGEIWAKIYHQKSKVTREMQALLKNTISVGESHRERVLIDKRLVHSDKFLFMEESYY